jgi:NADPH:quinone reductase-like Zn-dependent oxidoreductase
VGDLVQSLKTGGSVVAYSSITGAPQALGIADLIFRKIELRGWWLVNWLRDTSREQIEATYADLEALLEKGEIGSPVEATYQIQDYRSAFEHAARPGRSGKVMFTFPGGE